MDEAKFVDRIGDLKLLNALWKKPQAQLMVVYGRRRVGKTALLGRFARGKRLVHFIAYRSTAADILHDLSGQLYLYLNDGEKPGADFTYGGWKLLFETLASSAKDRRTGIIIDEFPYLVESDPSITSVLQSVWDSKLSHTNVFLCLSGSRIGMIKSEILEPKAPLYGRATATVHLKPVLFAELGAFFPKYGAVQLVEVYGITGGIPKYFEFISDGSPILKNIENAVRDRTTLLTAEADLLLNEEFRETRVYLAILRALGKGSLDLKNISNFCGLDAKVLSKYVDQLIDLNFIKRKIPAGTEPSKSRRGLYVISDKFLNFYFRFIAPHLQDIEKGLFNAVFEDIRKNFDSHIGVNAFEEICRDWTKAQVDKKKFSFIPEYIGEYWDKEMQIDVIGANHHDQMMLVGEVKWTNRKAGMDVLADLENRAKRICSKNGYYFQLILFSRAGFAPELEDTARKRNVTLVSLKDMAR